ncbi:MAG: putative aminohydrolase SsnA [Anaerolineaceae bacterium]
MIITNGIVITWGEPNEILQGRDLLIKEGLIAGVGKKGSFTAEHPQDEVLDAGGQLVMPGNICAHTHFYGAFSRGMSIPGDPPANFSEILAQLWWKLDKALDEEGVRYSALVCLADAIKYGTTTLFDHHASPNCIEGSLDIEHDAIVEAGLRASICYEVTDRDGNERAMDGVRENGRFISRVMNGEANPLVKAHFGLHASLTVSDATLEACLEENNGRVGFHSHASEGAVDEEDSLKKYGVRVIRRFADHGILGPKTILAHGVHADDEEIELLKQSQTWLTHQPRSNMNNAVGVAPILEMLKRGVRIGLGNDGFSNAMWQDWNEAYLVQKDAHRDPRVMGGYDVVKMAITNNSQLATETYDNLRVGRIEAGAAADLILVDYHPTTPMTAGNLPWHILFGFRDGMVTGTMVAGKLLMKDRKLLTLDEAEIAAKSREVAARTWTKVK